MVVMRMRQNDGRRGKRAQTVQPVRATVDHDACIIMLNQQRTVASMRSRADCDFAAGSKKCQLHCFAALGSGFGRVCGDFALLPRI